MRSGVGDELLLFPSCLDNVFSLCNCATQITMNGHHVVAAFLFFVWINGINDLGVGDCFDVCSAIVLNHVNAPYAVRCKG